MAKKIEIIPIAERKLVKRGIRREWVEDAVMKPMQVVVGYGARRVAHKKILIAGKDYLLRVVYEESENMYTYVYYSNGVSYIASEPLLEGVIK